jgi:hypothetical protein
MSDSKGQAHRNVVQMVLKVESKETAAPTGAEKQEAQG